MLRESFFVFLLSRSLKDNVLEERFSGECSEDIKAFWGDINLCTGSMYTRRNRAILWCYMTPRSLNCASLTGADEKQNDDSIILLLSSFTGSHEPSR